jgi:hypothetical protein
MFVDAIEFFIPQAFQFAPSEGFTTLPNAIERGEPLSCYLSRTQALRGGNQSASSASSRPWQSDLSQLRQVHLGVDGGRIEMLMAQNVGYFLE